MNKENKEKLYPCPHGRMPMGGQDGYKHCPHCLGINTPPPQEKPISDWVGEFDKRWHWDVIVFDGEQGQRENIKSFIRNLLTQKLQAQKEELAGKIEKMKNDTKEDALFQFNRLKFTEKNIKKMVAIACDIRQNKTLQDILDLIKNHEPNKV